MTWTSMINGPMAWMMVVIIFTMCILCATFLICFMRKRPAESFEGLEPTGNNDQILPYASEISEGANENKLRMMVPEERAVPSSVLAQWEEAAVLQIQSPRPVQSRKSPPRDASAHRSAGVSFERGAAIRMPPPTPPSGSPSRPNTGNTASLGMSTLLTEDTASIPIEVWRGGGKGSSRPRNQVAPAPRSPGSSAAAGGAQILRLHEEDP